MSFESFLKKASMLAAHRALPRLAGLIVGSFGLLVIMAWHAHWLPVLQMLPGTAPMKYNTALCFILSGAGLWLLAGPRQRLAAILGAIVSLFTLATLLEYFSGRDWGIDLLFFKPYIQTATSYSGRMSPLAAVCFIFVGAGIAVPQVKSFRSYRLAVTGLLGCCVGVIAIVAIFGYLLGIDAAYSWGAYTRMAVNTAFLFLLLGLGLMLWAWQAAREEQFDFLRWLPVTGAATLMAMIAFVSAVNMAELGTASHWRQHTFEVILDAQAFENNLIDIQRGMRGYVTLDDTNALIAYENSRHQEPAELTQLTTLTSDNPGQQARLKALAAAMTDVLSYDDQMIALFRQQGAQAVFVMDETGRGRLVIGNARDVLKAFSGEEKRLLDLRDASEQVDYHNAAKLLIFGSVLAALLLILANFMASRELNHRIRVEQCLRELTTLQNAILVSADYAIISLEANGVVQTFNPGAERLLGYSAAEIVGKVTPMLWRDPAEVSEQAAAMSRELGQPVAAGIDVITKKSFLRHADEYEATYVHKDGHRFPVLVSLTALADATGKVTGFLGIIADITERKKHETEREGLIAELQTALAQVKTLSGMIPICGWCKSVRSDEGYWQSVEQYVRAHSDATFSHGMCPNCTEKFKADVQKANQK